MHSPQTQESTDAELVRRLKAGDEEAFAEIYRRYSGRLMSYFYRMLQHDTEKARDLVQDVFFRVADKTESIQTRHSFAAWLFTIASNLCKNEHRRMATRSSLTFQENLDQFATDPYDINHDIERQDFREALFVELDKLTVKHREVFLLRYHLGLSLQEIADITASPPGTVKSRLFYTLRHLAKRLRAFENSI